MKKTNMALAGALLLAHAVGAQCPYYGISDCMWWYTEPLICGLFDAFVVLGASIGSLMIVYAGVKYLTSSDDPAGRKGAKDMIVHALIALIILMIADFAVCMITQGEAGCGVCW